MHIFYVRKGVYMRMGSSALVEQLPSGHIIKTPKMKPYLPRKRRESRQGKERRDLGLDDGTGTMCRHRQRPNGASEMASFRLAPVCATVLFSTTVGTRALLLRSSLCRP